MRCGWLTVTPPKTLGGRYDPDTVWLLWTAKHYKAPRKIPYHAVLSQYPPYSGAEDAHATWRCDSCALTVPGPEALTLLPVFPDGKLRKFCRYCVAPCTGCPRQTLVTQLTAGMCWRCHQASPLVYYVPVPRFQTLKSIVPAPAPKPPPPLESKHAAVPPPPPEVAAVDAGGGIDTDNDDADWATLEAANMLDDALRKARAWKGKIRARCLSCHGEITQGIRRVRSHGLGGRGGCTGCLSACPTCNTTAPPLDSKGWIPACVAGAVRWTRGIWPRELCNVCARRARGASVAGLTPSSSNAAKTHTFAASIRAMAHGVLPPAAAT